MTNRIFFFLFGFGLMVIGFTYIIMYANLLTMGYSFWEYLYFIFKRLECLYAIFGLIIIYFTIRIKGENNDVHL